ncbi:PREDICTED: peroxidase 40 [Ipomoea nil]|uniref:peroxidase 40 n=1 Tax=Ipomoea nil TaxID=35883 RepID=UPI0009017F38|nr:PREDICTED: peroxidase 40 [Ipomoea nil]
MGIYFPLLWLMIMKVWVVTSTPTTLNETCFDGATATFMLSFGWYQDSCPEAEAIVFAWVERVVSEDPRMAASLLRLHFHDCFVNGCDASVLLDDTPNFVGEKTAGPNLNSLRGFEVIDSIKADIEFVCPGTVSCADILAIAARDSVLLSGGPTWEVEMGRKDSISASKTAANNNIPGPNSDVPTLVSRFQNLGLTLQDMVTLSGAHTVGKARCFTFNSRLSSGNAPDVNGEFLQSLQQLCSVSDVNATLADLDAATPANFDNQYYLNLVAGKGLLTSDQVLATGDDQTRGIVESYIDDPTLFFESFKRSMMKMGRLAPGDGEGGEIRKNCRVVNELNF